VAEAVVAEPDLAEPDELEVVGSELTEPAPEPEREDTADEAAVVVDMTRAEPTPESEEPATSDPEPEDDPGPPAVEPEVVKEAPQKAEVDRVALTREFSQLFGDEGP
jgi:hypothetical protein